MCLNEKNERNEENVCKGLGRILGNVFNLLSCPEFCLCSKYEVMCSSFSGAGRWILFVFFDRARLAVSPSFQFLCYAKLISC